ncbi:MAG TPA: YciI-like protein [Polyangiaceae bacterium]|jgi:hypothetical protein|nr:YciI-like protein [Polyangiaceae bacterium]
MKHFALFYDLVPDYLERRAAHREEHLRLAWAAAERGELVLGGALSPPDTAMLVFRGASSDVAESFVRKDPYFVNGLVRSYRVREWTTVVGDLATTPIRG